MDFGIFNLMGYRRPGTRTHEVVDDVVTQVKSADEAGLSAAWFAEHHFSNYSVCPSPLMMVARLAGETSRIRLGTAAVIAPLYTPARLLAEIAMVDAMTHGRLELGLGSGYQPYEFERFNTDLAHSSEQLIEFIEMYEKAFSQVSFSHHGKHYQLAESHISTRPHNAPPPVWIAGENPQLVAYAARKGLPLMTSGRHFRIDLLEAARARIESTWREAGKSPQSLRLAALRSCCITDDRNEAASFVENVRHQFRLTASLRRREEVIDGGMLVERPFEGEPSLDELARHLLVGDAETVAERMITEIRRGGLSSYLLHFQPGAVPLSVALQSIERFAAEVRPMVERVVADPRLGVENRCGVAPSVAS